MTLNELRRKRVQVRFVSGREAVGTVVDVAPGHVTLQDTGAGPEVMVYLANVESVIVLEKSREKS